jgi:excisionase family DNA binding protein
LIDVSKSSSSLSSEPSQFLANNLPGPAGAKRQVGPTGLLIHHQNQPQKTILAVEESSVPISAQKCGLLQGANILPSERSAMPQSVRTQPEDILGDSRLVITVAEAATMLGISRSFAYELAKRGDLPVIQLGRRQLVSKTALAKMMEPS